MDKILKDFADDHKNKFLLASFLLPEDEILNVVTLGFFKCY